MKFEKLSEYKLKITMSNDELPNSNGDLDSFMSDSSVARKSFIDILDKAEDEVGFYVGDNKVRIDAKYLYNGDFLFTVTKLIPKSKPLKRVKPHKVKVTNKGNCVIYSFDNIENFFSLCNFFKEHHIDKLNTFCSVAELYDFNNKYFLVLDNINDNYEHIAKAYSCMPEFGQFFSSTESMAYMLRERGTLIIQNNAIQICQKNFK